MKYRDTVYAVINRNLYSEHQHDSPHTIAGLSVVGGRRVMDSVELMDVDEVWKTLGQFGRYQLLQLTVLVIAALPTAFHILSIVFIGESFYQISWLSWL